MRPALLALVLVAGCASAPRPAAPAAPRPADIVPIELYRGVHTMRYELSIMISPTGFVHSEENWGKNWGGGDTSPYRAPEIREGQLDPAQMDEIRALLAVVDREPFEADYAGVPDGPYIRLRWGDRSVTGDPPPALRAMLERVSKMALAMPIAK